MIDNKIFKPDAEIELLSVDREGDDDLYVIGFEDDTYYIADGDLGMSIYSKVDDKLVRIEQTLDSDDIDDGQLEELRLNILMAKKYFVVEKDF